MAVHAAPPAAEPSGAPDPASRVLRHFRLIFNAVKTHFRAVEKQTGVGGALVWALSVIEQHPGIGMGELARRMDIHQSTASNLVRNLISRRMAEGVRTGSDRRAVQLHLCAAGREILLKAPQPFSGVLTQALGALDKATLLRLESDLGTLIDLLGPAAHADEHTPILPA